MSRTIFSLTFFALVSCANSAADHREVALPFDGYFDASSIIPDQQGVTVIGTAGNTHDQVLYRYSKEGAFVWRFTATPNDYDLIPKTVIKDVVHGDQHSTICINHESTEKIPEAFSTIVIADQSGLVKTSQKLSFASSGYSAFVLEKCVPSGADLMAVGFARTPLFAPTALGPHRDYWIASIDKKLSLTKLVMIESKLPTIYQMVAAQRAGAGMVLVATDTHTTELVLIDEQANVKARKLVAGGLRLTDFRNGIELILGHDRTVKKMKFDNALGLLSDQSFALESARNVQFLAADQTGLRYIGNRVIGRKTMMVDGHIGADGRRREREVSWWQGHTEFSFAMAKDDKGNLLMVRRELGASGVNRNYFVEMK